MCQNRSQTETKDSLLAANPVSVQQGQIEDCVEDEGAKESLVTGGKVTRGQLCPAKKLGFYLEGFALQRDHSSCRMENGLEKDKIEGKQTSQKLLAAILVRGGGVYAAVVETEIREWIPQIFKGITARLVWEKGTDEGEEVENDTHISGFGN